MIGLLAVCEGRVNTGCETATITTEYDDDKNENVTTWTCNSYGNDDNKDCFLGSTIIYDKDGYKLSMDEAMTGDIILDGDSKPTKIIGWLHKSTRNKAMIVRIEDFAGGVIEISHRHLLFDRDNVPRFAQSFGAGERLRLGNGDYITVMDTRTYEDKANWMAPLTESGTILIGLSKVKASCYAEFEYHTIAHYYVKMKHYFSGYDDEGTRSYFDHAVMKIAKRIGL